MEIDIIKTLAGEGVASVLLVIIIVVIIRPALNQIGQARLEIQRQNDLLMQIEATLAEMTRQVRHSRRDTELLRRATRIAFAGQGNGNNREQIKTHYAAASQLLADDEADHILRQVKEGKVNDTHSGFH